jgi:hypothetical protein
MLSDGLRRLLDKAADGDPLEMVAEAREVCGEMARTLWFMASDDPELIGLDSDVERLDEILENLAALLETERGRLSDGPAT